jgi:hypothetical protein
MMMMPSISREIEPDMTNLSIVGKYNDLSINMKSIHVNSFGERELHPDERILYSVAKHAECGFFSPIPEYVLKRATPLMHTLKSQ